MSDIVVVDYGLGNILSVGRAFEYLGCTVQIATSPRDLKSARKIVLPGVGAFAAAVRRLEGSGLKESLQEASASGTPILGICLGMQLLFLTGYEHGRTSGLGLIEGEVRGMITLPDGDRALRLPEIGWHMIGTPTDVKRFGASIFLDTFGRFFYFIHSYEVKPVDSRIVTGSYQRGGNLVVASIAYKNLFGVQYHPEKSGKPGLELLQRFASY